MQSMKSLYQFAANITPETVTAAKKRDAVSLLADEELPGEQLIVFVVIPGPFGEASETFDDSPEQRYPLYPHAED